MSDSLVSLCTCSNIGDAQTIRASLEARGVPTLIDGEHQRNMLGLFGTVVALRIMVPRSQLRVAYELALEVIEDLPEPMFDDEEPTDSLGHEPMPHRRAQPEDLVAYPDDDDDYDYDSDNGGDDGGDDDDDDDDDDDRREPSLFVPRISFGTGLFFAFAQLSIGQIRLGLISAAIMVTLAYLRVLPITSNAPK